LRESTAANSLSTASIRKFITLRYFKVGNPELYFGTIVGSELILYNRSFRKTVNFEDTGKYYLSDMAETILVIRGRRCNRDFKFASIYDYMDVSILNKYERLESLMR
jgi:hypothetical protein